MTNLQRDALHSLGACGESLGCYCASTARFYMVRIISVSRCEEIKYHPHVIAVAGGASKAEAIVGVMRACHTGTLVTDEGAAEKIIQLL